MNDLGRKKGWVPITTFAFVEKLPTRLNFLDHLVPYKGSDDDLTIPWGVYGTASLKMYSYHAVHYARAKRRIPIQLTLWYYLGDAALSLQRLSRSIEECRGYMHMGRISSGLREQVHHELLAIAAKRFAKDRLDALKELQVTDLLIQEPVLFRDYLRQTKELLLGVHPVRQEIDAHEEESIQLASFKLKRDRIKLVEAQNFDDIVVEI